MSCRVAARCVALFACTRTTHLAEIFHSHWILPLSRSCRTHTRPCPDPAFVNRIRSRQSIGRDAGRQSLDYHIFDINFQKQSFSSRPRNITVSILCETSSTRSSGRREHMMCVCVSLAFWSTKHAHLTLGMLSIDRQPANAETKTHEKKNNVHLM